MQLAGIVDDEWSARMFAWLADNDDQLRGVLFTDRDAEREWDRRGPRRDVPRLSASDLVADAGCAALLVTSARSPVLPGLAGPVRMALRTSCGDDPPVGDPAYWCLRHGYDHVDLRLYRADDGFQPRGLLATRRVTVTADDYAAVADAVSAAVAELLRADPRALPEGDAEPVEVLPVDRDALRIDWSSTTTDIVRLVRSASGRATPAWTYLDGFPISIGSAEPAVRDGEPPGTAPGTVMHGDDAHLIARAGDGLVALSGIRDHIGALPLRLIRPGTRLGGDPAEELRQLRRRVADLERVVYWMVRDHGSAAVTAAEPTPYGPGNGSAR